MRTKLTLIALVVTISAFAQQKSSINYGEYFTPERLRIDLTFGGTATTQNIYLDNMAMAGKWSGSYNNLVDPFGYGEYMLEVKDITKTADGKESIGKIIYSKGFNTLFQEWQTTEEAQTTPKSFPSSYWIPMPKSPIQLIVSYRVKSTGKFKALFSTKIDPADKLIKRDNKYKFKVDTIQYNGNQNSKVDLTIIAEGYTADQMDKFRNDAKKFAGYLFKVEPYKHRIEDFNIWAIESISTDSGPDIPHHDIWKNTIAESNFYTFRTDRYLTAQDQSNICKIIGETPCDAIYVLVNTEKYGGGGIYNFYSLAMSDNKFEARVFVHEFGHSFAGLGDEYYTSDVAYEDFYNIKLEPWEPNITTLINFDKKWKSMIPSSTAIPTPALANKQDNTTVGAFEGGGYMAKGIFRPCMDCIMKTNEAKGFCPVCTKAIEAMIDYYCK